MQLSFLVSEKVVTGKIKSEIGVGRPRLDVIRSLSELVHVSEIVIMENTGDEESGNP